jgi:ABC-type dipeptide/oligopeptide/nickel transport system permease subunit
MTNVGVFTLVMIAVLSVATIPAFIVMLILGAILGNHEMYTPGFWETWGALVVVGITGSFWNSGANVTKNSKGNS